VSFVALLFLALGLSMDAMAVAAAKGFAAKNVRVRDALLVALFFGGFQAGMPAIGGALGGAFAARILGWGHWVTFVVLGIIGGKMIYEALKDDDDDNSEKTAPASIFGLRVLFMLAIATSIDALAAGVTLGLLGVSMIAACSLIGVVTGALSFGGVYIGRRFGTRVGKRFEVIGGLVLVGLGVKAVAEHFLAAR
jgi:putative Mn2+ efflux pump MntP